MTIPTSKLFESNGKFTKRFGQIEYASHIIYNRGGYCFRGKIDSIRFITALGQVFNENTFLLSYLEKNTTDNTWYANYPPKEGTKLIDQLEIQIKENESIESSTFESVISFKGIDKRMVSVVLDLEGLPMCIFKLSIFNDGFSIGFIIHHSLFDQSSMYYLFKYISNIYSSKGGLGSNILPKPSILNGEDFIYSTNTFSNIDEFYSFGNAIGYTRSTDSDTTNDGPQQPEESEIIRLTFNVNEIENQIKSSGPQKYFSVNDMIHAIVLKIFSFNQQLKDTEEFCLRYSCNMRKRLNVGQECIGNLVGQYAITAKIGDIRNSNSLLDLALISRKNVMDINVDQFKKTVSWFKYLQNINDHPLNYFGKSKPTITNVTNWTSFDYDKIQFDGISPYEIKVPCIARYGVSLISFTISSQDNIKSYETTIYIPTNNLNSIQELSNASKLFKINQQQ